MTDAAVISGSLVDAKNVNTHKVMRLIIDVPAENALKVIAAFGWPTMVNPVSVAVARLNEHASPRAGLLPVVEAAPRPTQGAVPAGEDKRSFADLMPPQQAGILCNEPAFRRFLQERFVDDWNSTSIELDCHPLNTSPRVTAECVRRMCGVKSRAEITRNNTEWASLVLAYRLWQNHPELEDA